MAATSGSLNYVPPADNHKEMFSSTIAFLPGDDAAVVVNPPNLMHAATIFNPSTYWMRGTVVYSAGILFDGPPTEHCMLIPPAGEYSFDLSAHEGGGAPGATPPIDSMFFNLVSLGTTTQGSNGLVEVPHPTGVVCAVNFVTN